MNNQFLESDSKRGGFFSTMVKKISTIEEWIRKHNSVVHYNIIPASISPTFVPEVGSFIGETITVNSARYIDLGKLVYMFFDVSIVNIGTGSPAGSLLIRSIPETPRTFGTIDGLEISVIGLGLSGYVDITPQIIVRRTDGATIIVNGYRIFVSTVFERA